MPFEAVPPEILPKALLERIARVGRTRTFTTHSILVHEGDGTDTLYVLFAGRVKVYATSDEGREVVLSELGAGEYFGELSLDGTPRSASVKATEACTCCMLSGAQVHALLAEEPDFAWHLTHKLIRMARRLTAQVKSLALQDVYGRIARLLIEASDAVGDERVVRQRLTQQDIADRVGSSREMVNRILKELVTGGYVSVREGRHVIHRKLPAAW